MFNALAILEESGRQEDSAINLFNVAIALCADAHKGISLDKYFNHAVKMIREVGLRHEELVAAGAVDDARCRLASLKFVLAEREGYAGDVDTYDDIQNADLIRVIERRRGLPVALAILYIHVGRSNGWVVDGLNFPGHFLCRIEYAGERLIFDPFDSCKIMDAPALRSLLKKFRGENAELSADFYKPCANRDTLIRLENNIKLRLIEAEEYDAALKTVEMMRCLDPSEYRLLLDAGVLYAKTGRNEEAVDVLEKYIASTPSARDRLDAQNILRQILATMA